MVNSRQKGKRGELEARDRVREFWYAPNCIRAAQACGAFSADLLNALPNAHVEVKRYKRLGLLAKAMNQAMEDAREGELPVVLCREDQGQWILALPLHFTEKFVDQFLENRHGTRARDSERSDQETPGREGADLAS